MSRARRARARRRQGLAAGAATVTAVVAPTTTAITPTTTDAIPAGVVTQNPPAGTTAGKGTTVQFTYGRPTG
jgi:beta-lactam-binding protein with PASTA domain